LPPREGKKEELCPSFTPAIRSDVKKEEEDEKKDPSYLYASFLISSKSFRLSPRGSDKGRGGKKKGRGGGDRGGELPVLPFLKRCFVTARGRERRRRKKRGDEEYAEWLNVSLLLP